MRVSSVTGTLFGRPVLETMARVDAADDDGDLVPALNVCSVGIVGNRRRYLSVIVTGVSAACWNNSESRFCDVEDAARHAPRRDVRGRLDRVQVARVLDLRGGRRSAKCTSAPTALPAQTLPVRAVAPAVARGRRASRRRWARSLERDHLRCVARRGRRSTTLRPGQLRNDCAGKPPEAATLVEQFCCRRDGRTAPSGRRSPCRTSGRPWSAAAR